MDQEYINLLSLSEYYRIISKKTHKTYIDANNSCYLFDNTMDADSFMKNLQDTELSELELLKPSIYISDMYGLGIDTIQVKKGVEDNFIKINITKDDCNRRFYNRLTNRNILRLIQTGDKKYLNALKQCEFICPTYIKKRLPKEYNILHYGCVRTAANERYMILFTNILEFDQWNESQEDKYKPLKVDFLKESHIKKSEKIVIDPLSNKLVINDNVFKMIMKSDK